MVNIFGCIFFLSVFYDCFDASARSLSIRFVRSMNCSTDNCSGRLPKSSLSGSMHPAGISPLMELRIVLRRCPNVVFTEMSALDIREEGLSRQGIRYCCGNWIDDVSE